MRVVTFFHDVNHKHQLVYSVFSKLLRLCVLVAVLHQLLRLTHQCHHQVNLCFKGSHRITTFVAIFPSRFQWWEHKRGCNVWSSHLGFENAVSGILEFRYPLLYLPVFRYACCSLVYFNLQLIWWSCGCLFSSCHILCKLACSGSGL